MQTAYAATSIESHILRGLAPGEVQHVIENSQAYSYAPGETIYHAEDRARQFMLLTHGAAKVWVPGPTPLIFDIILPGELFGGTGSDEYEPGEEEAQALENTVVRVLSLDRLLGNNGDRVPIALRLLELQNQRAADARRQWRSVVTDDVPHRLGRRLLELLRHAPEEAETSQIPVRLRQEDLAYMVGSTRTTVSEILNDFERRGLIELRRASVRVNRERLRQALWPAA